MSVPPQDPPGGREPDATPDPTDETVVRDTWGEETVSPERRILPEETYVAEEVVEEQEVVPVRRGPLIWPWLLAFLVLVLGGLGAYVYFAQADESTVPAVVGEPQERAEARVREAGLEPQSEPKESARPRGIVLEQSPDAGAEVDEGATVLLTVSSGTPRETVPDVVGVTTGEAIASLKDAGFEADVSEAFSDKRVGEVVRQQPEAGGNLKEGSTVALTVSKGREPVTVPDVVGATSEAATATLKQAGLESNPVAVPSEEPAGTVVAQNPGPGKSAKRGDTVRLNVARAPDETTPATTETAPTTTTSPTTTAPETGPATVPDAVGSALADAARAFGAVGLKVSVEPVPSDEQAGTVVAQAQPAGTELERGDTVQVNVSIGPDPAPDTTVPDVTGRQLADARRRLAAAGFEVLSIRQSGNASRAGVVLSQTPDGNATVPRGSLVILYVGA